MDAARVDASNGLSTEAKLSRVRATGVPVGDAAAAEKVSKSSSSCIELTLVLFVLSSSSKVMRFLTVVAGQRRASCVSRVDGW